MGTVNDEILRSTGGPTISDGLRAFFVASGVPDEGTLQDMERKYLLFSIVSPIPAKATNQDLWMAFAAEQGFTGTFNDRMLQFFTSK